MKPSNDNVRLPLAVPVPVVTHWQSVTLAGALLLFIEL